jgi:hypothetical protein
VEGMKKDSFVLKAFFFFAFSHYYSLVKKREKA